MFASSSIFFFWFSLSLLAKFSDLKCFKFSPAGWPFTMSGRFSFSLESMPSLSMFGSVWSLSIFVFIIPLSGCAIENVSSDCDEDKNSIGWPRIALSFSWCEVTPGTSPVLSSTCSSSTCSTLKSTLGSVMKFSSFISLLWSNGPSSNASNENGSNSDPWIWTASIALSSISSLSAISKLDVLSAS